ncbi:GlxA family transcriptional regulator [Alteromonas sp. 009811495]|uniref:GlxA family transcriptional regulator n=1 Tax=Alteromonas sp. 009811495 TaxID=3002962 RepID=UPI00237DAD04|nr:helix-turn-helix domain-containing protein [Alteromonas sp. 009811495]WDT84775.1 helix-turn-helix domain-containing protein [Alteromonas sp. 009811495]
MKQVAVQIIDYLTASKAAVFGLLEMMELANTICRQLNADVCFDVKVLTTSALSETEPSDVIVLPPSTSEDFFDNDFSDLIDYLHLQQEKGATLASACVGAFILATGGFLNNKVCTTHWRIAQDFNRAFPNAKLDANAIVASDDGVITAGGRMAWIDLGFEVISQFSSPAIASHLSKEMVIDTGYREQGYYHQFSPDLSHKDELVLKVQRYLAEHFASPLQVKAIADIHFVSVRTLQRRFTQTLGLTLIEYLQKLRLHHACQHMEISKLSVNDIAYAVGYQNVNAFRKVFKSEYGLSPVEYRKRFSITE